MLYDIHLEITYSYEAQADAGYHLLHMQPAGIDGMQRVIASSLDIDPIPPERIPGKDFFGNQFVSIAFHDPVDELAFRLRARVERFAPPELLDMSPGLADLQREVRQTTGMTGDSPVHFTGQSPRIRRVSQISRWANSLGCETMSAFQAVGAVCSALHSEMTFDPEATAVDTPLETAFSNRRGVCQDFTHIAISALRSLSIPAGYVSGFLRTIPPEGQPRLEGADAMHAWVRAWCGFEMGWVEFDPTNNMMAGDDHVVVAVGRDYFDVSPVKGTMRTAGAQLSSQSVDMLVVDGGGKN